MIFTEFQLPQAGDNGLWGGQVEIDGDLLRRVVINLYTGYWYRAGIEKTAEFTIQADIGDVEQFAHELLEACEQAKEDFDKWIAELKTRRQKAQLAKVEA